MGSPQILRMNLSMDSMTAQGCLRYKFLSDQEQVRAVPALEQEGGSPSVQDSRVPPLWASSLAGRALLPLCVPSALRKQGQFSEEGVKVWREA